MRLIHTLSARIRKLTRGVTRSPRMLFAWVVRTLSSLFSAIFRFPAAVFKAVTTLITNSLKHLLQTARLRDFLFGLPSLIILLCFGGLSVTTFRGSTTHNVELYDSAVRKAVAAGNYDAAKLYLKRIIQSGADRPSTRLQLSKLAIENGDAETANVLLSDLAPVDRPVQFEAHVWRAQQILSRQQIGSSDLLEAEAQLVNATLLRKSDPIANSLLGQLYRQTGRHVDAKDRFLRFSPRSPTDELYLADVYLKLDEPLLSRAAAERAQTGFVKRLDRRPRDIESLVRLAAAYRMTEDFAAADRALRRNQILKDNPRLKRERIVNLIAWYDELPTDDSSLARRLELLRRALRIDSGEPLIYDRLLHLLLDDGRGSDVVRRSLQDQLAIGAAPDLTHLLLGIDATNRNKQETAVHHYRSALELNPSLSVAANNLALSLLAITPPKEEEAEAIMEELCRLNPEVAAFQETRGQVLLRLGKHQQALSAFNRAIGELPHEPSIHRGMKFCYEALGLEELAQSHHKWLQENTGENK